MSIDSASSSSSSSSSYSQINPNSPNHPGYTLTTINGFTDPHIKSYSTTFPRTAPVSPLLQKKTERSPSCDTCDRLDKHRQPPFSPLMDGISPLVVVPDSPKTVTVANPPNSPLSKREIRHIKKYDKEPLVNKSPTVHIRRKAEYIDIDLPDSASESSTGSSIYDTPSSIPAPLEQPVYDVPPLPKPLEQNTYDVPSSIRHETTPTPSSARSTSLSPTNRALPHLPTDYENVQPPPKNLGVRQYVNVDFKEKVPDSGLYMVVPLKQEKLQTKSLTNLYSDIPERMESQLNIRRVESDQPVSNPGERIAKQLEEEGYEFINPATLPALKSPPVAPSVQTVPEDEDLTEDDQYIEVRRLTPPSSKRSPMPPPPQETTGERHDSKVAFCNVPSRSKRLSDGYEEITEVIREFRGRSPPSPKPERKPSEIDKEEDVQASKKGPKEDEDLSTPPPDTPKLTKQTSRSSSTNSESGLEKVTLTFTGNIKEYSSGYLSNESDDDDEDFEDASQIRTKPGHSSLDMSRSSKHLIPTAVGSPETSHAMLLRKRSLTIGDPLDNKEPKKHTYVNVTDDTAIVTPPRSPSVDLQPKKKPPMPLPRPSLSKIEPCATGNHNNNSNNRVKTLVRQFSDI